jgi:hypothetical protein
MRLIATLVAAGAVFAATQIGAAAQSAGTPLTKEQYAERAFDLMEMESRSQDLYYDLALKRFEKRECVRKLKRYTRMIERVPAAADAEIPPAEIAADHDRLVVAGYQVVRRIGKTAGGVRAGKLRCGDYFGRPSQDLAGRIYAIFSESPVDEIMGRFYDEGYILGGH